MYADKRCSVECGPSRSDHYEKSGILIHTLQVLSSELYILHQKIWELSRLLPPQSVMINLLSGKKSFCQTKELFKPVY